MGKRENPTTKFHPQGPDDGKRRKRTRNGTTCPPVDTRPPIRTRRRERIRQRRPSQPLVANGHPTGICKNGTDNTTETNKKENRNTKTKRPDNNRRETRTKRTKAIPKYRRHQSTRQTIERRETKNKKAA